MEEAELEVEEMKMLRFTLGVSTTEKTEMSTSEGQDSSGCEVWRQS